MTKQHFFDISSTLIDEYLSARPQTDILYFDAPLVCVAAADDPLFEKMKEPQAVGGHFITPQQWLEGAKSVVSIFVPYSDSVKQANNACPKGEIAPEYIHAKNYALPFLDTLLEKLVSAVKSEGYSVVVPSKEAERMKQAITTADGGRMQYTSGWSERHAAYICGLGSFGISGGLITEKGVAGRYVSFVTDMPLETDSRQYSHTYEYCTFCGACAARCPAGAITMEKGKDKAKCSAFVNSTKEKFAPLYGCARCQCGVPCANGVPAGQKQRK